MSLGQSTMSVLGTASTVLQPSEAGTDHFHSKNFDFSNGSTAGAQRWRSLMKIPAWQCLEMPKERSDLGLDLNGWHWEHESCTQGRWSTTDM